MAANLTYEELFDEFDIDEDDRVECDFYSTEYDDPSALTEAVAQFFEDEYSFTYNDALEFIRVHGVRQAHYAVVHESVCYGNYDSLEDFWISYADEMYPELREALDLVTSSGFHFPEVDTLVVGQDFTMYPEGTVVRDSW
jgi:hypothetical protein